MYKRIFVIFILIIIIVSAAILNKNSSKKYNKDTINSIEQNIKFFEDNLLSNKNLTTGFFKDRFVSINNNGLSIGKNKNELENGYYDINVIVEGKYIEIYINKLFKEFDKNIICDEVYVNEITEYILNLFNLKIDKKVFSELIITNYEIIRDIDRNNMETANKTVSISNINIVISVEKNILVLKIGDI